MKENAKQANADRAWELLVWVGPSGGPLKSNSVGMSPSILGASGGTHSSKKRHFRSSAKSSCPASAVMACHRTACSVPWSTWRTVHFDFFKKTARAKVLAKAEANARRTSLVVELRDVWELWETFPGHKRRFPTCHSLGHLVATRGGISSAPPRSSGGCERVERGWIPVDTESPSQPAPEVKTQTP